MEQEPKNSLGLTYRSLEDKRLQIIKRKEEIAKLKDEGLQDIESLNKISEKLQEVINELKKDAS